MVRIGSMLDKVLVWLTNLVASKTTFLVVDGPEVSLTVAIGTLEISKELARLLWNTPTWYGVVRANKRFDLSVRIMSGKGGHCEGSGRTGNVIGTTWGEAVFTTVVIQSNVVA
jgi:hypothetical protein